MTRTRKDPRTKRARSLRNDATPFEKRLWLQLKKLPVEGHFRRQVPVGPYFADFAHHGFRLIIELDGDQHGHADRAARDEVRTRYLEAAGYRVLRFWNHEIVENLDGVIDTIMLAFPPTHNPSPPQAGGGGRQGRSCSPSHSPACGGEGGGPPAMHANETQPSTGHHPC